MLTTRIVSVLVAQIRVTPTPAPIATRAVHQVAANQSRKEIPTKNQPHLIIEV